MASTINYASTATVGAALLTTGDTSRTAPTTTGTIFTASVGGQVERIVIIPVGNTVTSVVRIFRYDGTVYNLYAEIPISAQTLSGTSAVTTITLEAVTTPNLFPILVPTGWSLRATVNDTQVGIKVQAEGGAY
jgi:hypothetical protein